MVTGIIRRLRSVLLIIAACVICLGLAEGMVRVVDPHARDHVIPGGFFTMDATLGWRLKPETTVTHHSQYFTATYAVNTLGYRDRPRTISKNAGRVRALLYGDSEVFGWGIPDMLRFSNLVESEDPRLEVWNLAVPGYGLDQQIIAYENEGQRWNPDIVVFFISHSTLRRMNTGYVFQKYKPRFVLDDSGALQLVPVPSQATTLKSAIYQLFSQWYLPYFLERRVAIISEMIDRWSAGANTRKPLHFSWDRLAETLLERAAKRAQIQGHRLMLLVDLLPSPSRETLRTFSARHGLQVVMVDFPGQREAFTFGKQDRHWNTRAHRWIAERFLEQWSAT